MNRTPLLVTMASWEERFLLGFRRTLSDAEPDTVLMFFLDGYADWTRENREAVDAEGRALGVRVLEEELALSSPHENWKRMGDRLSRLVEAGQQVLVDITTMPREQIWSVFWFLDFRQCRVRFVYHSPEGYNGEWLSRDPLPPRLVYKMSGIAKLNARTCLVVLPGFDVERAKQLISFFEPAITFVGLQANGGDAMNDAKMAENEARLKGERGVEFFQLDAYGSDQGQADIMERVKKGLYKHNIVMSSLGPKPSAVALYRIHREHPEVGLAYAPSRQFNHEYSHGIGKVCSGVV